MALSKGHEILCCDRNRRGGLKKIWLVEQTTMTSADVVFSTTGHRIDQFDTDDLYQFDFERGTAGFTAAATRENGSTLVNVELEFYIPKITEEINDILSDLTESCGVHAIVETFADDCDEPTPETYFFVLGYDKVFEEKAYLEFSSGEQSTGVGLQDPNGTAVKLVGVQAEYPRELNVGPGSGFITMTPGANFIDAWTVATTP